MSLDIEPRHIFKCFVEEHGNEGPVGQLAQTLSEGVLHRNSFDEVFRVWPQRDLKKSLLDLILYYIRAVLADHRLTDDEQAVIRELKAICQIAEGDFIELRRAQVASLLDEQLQHMLDDEWIDDAESLRQVDIQRAFDLGYDDYLMLTGPAVDTAMQRLIARASVLPPHSLEERECIDRQIAALNSVWRLAKQRRQFY